MYAPMKYVEKALSIAANGAWLAFSRLNRIRHVRRSRRSGRTCRC